MLNDYKPTHDPNLDTFKVQYLIGASAVLAILFPYKYSFTEVGVGSIRAGRANR
jgi:ER lumen protein retaining receptor